MKKYITKTWGMLTAIAIAVSCFTINAFAGSFSVSAPASVSPGAAFNVAVGVSGVIGRINLSASNASLSTYSVFCDGTCEPVTATAGGSGTITITATAATLADAVTGDESLNGTSRSTTVSIVAPSGGGSSGGSSGGNKGNSNANVPAPVEDTRSTNNNLAALSISTGELTPAFDASVTEYTVNLNADATKITLDAAAADEKSSVSGTGEKELKAGDNVFTITCTAENGAAKNYTVNVHVDEKPLVYGKFGNTKLGVVRNTEGINVPKGFVQGATTFGGKEVVAFENKTTKQLLLYLVDDKNVKNFYLYDVKKGITSIYRPITICGMELVQISVPEKFKNMNGFKSAKVTIDENSLEGWNFEDKNFANYQLVYLMDQNGKASFYQYEKTQKKLQLYSNAAPVTQDAYDELISDKDSAQTQTIIFIVLTIIFVITTAGSIFLIWKQGLLNSSLFKMNKSSKSITIDSSDN